MNIYGSLMDIYDEKNKDVCDEKQIFTTKKTKDIYVEKNENTNKKAICSYNK